MVKVYQPVELMPTLNEYVPKSVGVPVMAPVRELRRRPGGNAPDAIEYVASGYAVALTPSMYGSPSNVTPRTVLSFMIGGCETTIDNAGVVTEPEMFVAVIANENAPYESNVPVKAPVCELSEIPGGKLPLEIE